MRISRIRPCSRRRRGLRAVAGPAAERRSRGCPGRCRSSGDRRSRPDGGPGRAARIDANHATLAPPESRSRPLEPSRRLPASAVSRQPDSSTRRCSAFPQRRGRPTAVPAQSRCAGLSGPLPGPRTHRAKITPGGGRVAHLPHGRHCDHGFHRLGPAGRPMGRVLRFRYRRPLLRLGLPLAQEEDSVTTPGRLGKHLRRHRVHDWAGTSCRQLGCGCSGLLLHGRRRFPLSPVPPAEAGLTSTFLDDPSAIATRPLSARPSTAAPGPRVRSVQSFRLARSTRRRGVRTASARPSPGAGPG